MWLTEKNVGLNQSAFLEESRSACAPAALDPELQLHVLWFEQLLPLMKVTRPERPLTAEKGVKPSPSLHCFSP